VVFFSNPSLMYVTPAGCSNFVLGDSISNVSGLIQTTRSRVSQWSIGSSLQWTDVAGGSSGAGTYYSPFGRVYNSVRSVQGGVGEAQVDVSGGTYNETAASGGPVVYNNPCVVTNVAGPYSRIGSALLR
jgi:hypothetical protein